MFDGRVSVPAVAAPTATVAPERSDSTAALTNIPSAKSLEHCALGEVYEVAANGSLKVSDLESDLSSSMVVPDVVGRCVDCSCPYDRFSGLVVCTVCRLPVLVCDVCAEEKCYPGEYHCFRHRCDTGKCRFVGLLLSWSIFLSSIIFSLSSFPHISLFLFFLPSLSPLFCASHYCPYLLSSTSSRQLASSFFNFHSCLPSSGLLLLFCDNSMLYNCFPVWYEDPHTHTRNRASPVVLLSFSIMIIIAFLVYRFFIQTDI